MISHPAGIRSGRDLVNLLLLYRLTDHAVFGSIETIGKYKTKNKCGATADPGANGPHSLQPIHLNFTGGLP